MRNMRLWSFAVCFIATGLIFVGPGGAGTEKQTVYIRNAWVQEAPPAARVLAAYMVIENSGERLKVLTAVESPYFERVEIHKSEMHGDMARMVRMERVGIPSRGKLTFERGGLHLMLIGPKKRLKAGDDVEITFHFDDGKEITIKAGVRRRTRKMMEQGHLGHQDHH